MKANAAKPVKAWAVLGRSGRIIPALIWSTRQDARMVRSKGERIARVQITELPRRRKA